ncbi:MAG: T9SS type A sorting domain-containing protein [Bacteroidota bacterium]
MKNLTTTIIALFTITSSFASNTNPSTAALTASVNNNTVALSFTANSNFEIERSFYSNEFTTIATVNNVFASNFRINDNAAELAGRKVAYYRVKTIAANGSVSYSNTMVVSINNNEVATAATASVKFNADQNGNATITVKNAAGKTVSVKNTIASKGANAVTLTSGLAKGFYTATVTVNGVTVATEKVIAE